MKAVIYCQPSIGWQGPFAQKMSAGLKVLGIPHEITSDRGRREGLPILLGTSCWRSLERGDYLLVDRCSFGDTNHWVSLVRNGHGRRGDHRVPVDAPAWRWERYGVPVAPWGSGSRRVLCGQTESYAPVELSDFYRDMAPHCTHFRKHPAGSNPTGLKECKTFDNVGLLVTLNSSVAVAGILAGCPTVTMDEGSMAWDVSSHDPREVIKPVRREWFHWLAWTQWTHDEISEGRPWLHML